MHKGRLLRENGHSYVTCQDHSLCIGKYEYDTTGTGRTEDISNLSE